jgi:hypothetical protein
MLLDLQIPVRTQQRMRQAAGVSAYDHPDQATLDGLIHIAAVERGGPTDGINQVQGRLRAMRPPDAPEAGWNIPRRAVSEALKRLYPDAFSARSTMMSVRIQRREYFAPYYQVSPNSPRMCNKSPLV